MNRRRYKLYHAYLTQNVIAPFYQTRLAGLQSLQLKTVLKRKNPYLFKAKNLGRANDLVRSIVDAFLSSQEETIFGNLLEGFAIYVSGQLFGGFKSALKSIDLEFERNKTYFIVGIKSGTNWGNSDQINRMRDNFKTARALLRANGVTHDIVAVNGCIYGKDRIPLKIHTDTEMQYLKCAGQDFWQFISEDDNLYREIIAPIDQEARVKDETFQKAYDAKINEMTEEFLANFMTSEKQIDWLKLVDFVSKRETIKPRPG